MVSVIVSPEEFYVHPIQESSGDLATVERELDSLVQGDKVARPEEVVVGSVWAVHNNDDWCRMKVTKVKGFKCERVNMRSIDYGHCLQDVDVRQLNRLPTGPASMVGGLAVRCHLAMIKHIKVEDTLTTQVLTEYLGGEKVHNAIFVERKSESIGVVIMIEEKGISSTVNQRLVEVGCASSSLFGDDVETSSHVGEDWDPMAEDYNSNTNNYMTNDDDLEIATDGYKSKEKVCAFYTNRGHCYKGAYCEDKHTLPREGAVTADQEEVIITTVDVMKMPCVKSTVLVKVTWVMSPSAFYITFPRGVLDVNIEPAGNIKTKPTALSNMMSSMQEFYKSNTRKLFMDSLPAPGSLIIAKSDIDQQWHRAMVRDSSEGEVDVFMVDLGKVEVVTLSNTRKMSSCFSVLPFQAVLACLGGVEPTGHGWSGEATQLFKKVLVSSPHLTAHVISCVSDQPLVVELGFRDKVDDSLHLNLGEVLQENGWARKVVVGENRKPFSVHIPG